MRGEQRDHFLHAHRLALRHVKGEDLLDVVLHLVKVALHRHRLAATEDAGPGGLSDVDVRLPGPHLQSDGLRAERSGGYRVEVATLQFAIAGDHLVGHPAVEAGDHLDSTRPVLGCQRPLDAGLVAMGHAHEAAAAQHRLPAGAVTEAQHPLHHRQPDVVRVLVGDQFDVVEPDRFPALDAQLEHQPVRQVDKVLVQDRAAPEDGGLPVEPAVDVGAWIVDAAGVLPLGGAAGAEVAVACRRQRLPQALGAGVEVVIDECKVGHGSLSESERPWSAGQGRQQLFHLCGEDEDEVGGSGRRSRGRRRCQSIFGWSSSTILPGMTLSRSGR